ncbi:hypothetical protein PUNSTDRAFT_134420 [Punctularia strigosozonata HHB-11173 SS5]|uniref:uncharacterized protein n=1 Tax=Punctularia strigosozonata (strain HHB-11173) TaxID=741275 RepID=UPI0004418172|nr:uncharacterized protein PUNSTDRAFT_134420 [Punctularia strigosozonata HHB-11173 SS5]EIN09260.1 hypothetical protein PUNSTDRAFT_134420 [Punctularia strigosozonata HHB-11173 SS5]
MHTIYYYTIDNFANELALLYVVWSMKLQIAITALFIPCVQSLYAWRVWKLRGDDRILPFIVFLTVIGGWIVGCMSTRDAYRLHTFKDFLGRSTRATIFADFGISTSVDTAISFTLCFYLYRTRSDFPRARSIIHSLMYYVVATGLLTSACAIVILVTFAVMANNFIYLSMEILLSKLYLNSFLAMMNARHVLRERATAYSVPRSSQRSVQVAEQARDYELSLRSPYNAEILDITKPDKVASTV